MYDVDTQECDTYSDGLKKLAHILLELLVCYKYNTHKPERA